MIGRTLSHYRITAALGAGAMGEVYRATDNKLGRDVALKVLPAEMASSPDRLERFRREAQTLAALDHPGIVTVHSVEEAEGLHFLTMQLVEGQSLDQLIEQGTLPVELIVDVAGALADALGAAHAKGVVHRDLKPANVMVAKDGRVKVLDFGLAKMHTPTSIGGSSQVLTQLQTEEGTVLGTVPYMSPEQVRAQELDHRSDLFSFGVLLYEMSTGRRPFAGESAAELASAILRDAPTPPSELRPDLTAGLLRVIERCLEKMPEARFENAQILLDTLHGNELDEAPDSTQARSHDAQHVAEPSRIAVLPFSNLSADPEQEYFSDGMAEEILNALASVSGLRVVARSSAFSFKGQSVDVRTIGQKLRVGQVLEGSVRRAGSRLRINAQLVSTTDGYQLWNGVFDREMTDVFEIQEEIARAIVAELRGQLAPAQEARSLVHGGTENLEAYHHYLRGRYFLGIGTPEATLQAIDAFEQGVATDPEHAEAWGSLGMAWVLRHYWGESFAAVAEAMGRACERALAIDPQQTAGLVTKAWHTVRTRWDWRTAEKLYQKAMAHIERDEFALDFYAGGHLVATGRVDRAVALYRRALEASPLSHNLRWGLAAVLIVAGRGGEAVTAVDELPAALERVPDEWFTLRERIQAYHALEEKVRVERLTERLRELIESRPALRFFLAWALITCGRLEEGLTELEQAIEVETLTDVWTRTYLGRDPVVWQHPRFQAVLERLRLDDASLREQGFDVAAPPGLHP